MRNILPIAVVSLLSSLLIACSERQTPIEEDAEMYASGRAAVWVADIVKDEGWPCDSISFISQESLMYEDERTFDTFWMIDCNNSQHQYTMVESTRGSLRTIKVEAISSHTARGEPEQPNIVLIVLTALWVGLTQNELLLIPFAIAGGILYLAVQGLLKVFRRRRN